MSLTPAEYLDLFEDIGSIIKAIDIFHGTAAGPTGTPDTVANLRDHLYATLNTNTSENTIRGIRDAYENYANGMSSNISRLLDLAHQRLTDRDTVVYKLLSTPIFDIQELLAEIIRDLRAQGLTFNQSVSTVPAQGSAIAANTGDGTVYLTNILDGYTPPSFDMAPQFDYTGRDSELIVPAETLTFTCTQDADSDDVARGEETFIVEGESGWRRQYDWLLEGSGITGTMSTDNAAGIVANRDFESWNDSNIPESWDVISGAPGVDFTPEYEVANVIAGQASLHALGDFELNQIIPPGIGIRPNRLYRISLWTSAPIATTSTLDFDIYSEAGIVSFPPGVSTSTIGDAVVPRTALMMMPASIPDDMRFRLKSSAFQEEYYVDRLSFAPVRYFGGVGVNILAGSVDFRRHDRFTGAVSNVEGTFQRYWRRRYGVQMPSATSLFDFDDSLAE